MFQPNESEGASVSVLMESILSLFQWVFYGILELLRHCGILELFHHCGILELLRHCGILELLRHCGILELFVTVVF